MLGFHCLFLPLTTYNDTVVCVHDRRSHWTELHRGLLYKMLVIDTFEELKRGGNSHSLTLHSHIIVPNFNVNGEEIN